MPIARAMGEQPNGRYAKSRNRPRINKQELPQGSPTNPNANPYEPRGAAEALMYCKADEILLEGPAGTGKTRAVLEKINLCLMKYSRSRGLIVRKTRAAMTESVLVTYERKVLPIGTAMAQGMQRKLRTSYTYPNGSELVVAGIDNPDRIMSTEYDIIAAFEATELNEADWEMLTSRNRNFVMPYQQGICDCNPGGPSHWLNARAKKADSESGKPMMERLLSRHQDNPVMFDVKLGTWTEQGQKYLAKLSRLSGHRRVRLLEGKWAAAEGMVYPEFDRDVHVIDPLPLSVTKNWRRICSIDFGFVHPFIWQRWAIDGDGRMFLEKEIYFSGRTVDEHAKRIIELNRGLQIEETISDHDAEDRATLERHGIYTMPAHKAIRPGIEAVQLRFRPDGLGRSRIFFFRDALDELDEKLLEGKKPPCTPDEIEGYIYPPRREGRIEKEDPLKVDDDGDDAMRYAVAYVDDLDGMDLSIVGSPVMAVGAGYSPFRAV